MSARNDAPRAREVARTPARASAESSVGLRPSAQRRQQHGEILRAARTRAARRVSAPRGAVARAARPARRSLGLRAPRAGPRRPRRRGRAARGRRGRSRRCAPAGRRAPTPGRAARGPELARSPRSRPSRPCSCVPGCDVLPAEEEAHEVGRRDRLDLACAGARASGGGCAPAAARRTTRRPSDARREAAAQDAAVGLEPRERRRRRAAAGSPSRAASAAAVVGPMHPSSRARSRTSASSRVAPALAVAGERLSLGRRKTRPGSAVRTQLHALGGDEARGSEPTLARRRSPARAISAVEPARSSRAASRSRQQAERQQRVVQLVGVAHVRPRLAPHLGDRRGVERAEAARRGRDRCGAATRRGRGAPPAARRRGRRTGWR